jgi:hypothetical protein
MQHRITVTAALLAMLGAGSAAAAPLELQAMRADKPVEIDGSVDAGWNKAAPLKLVLDELPYKPNNGYDGMTRTEVELRALYDDENVYFLVRYQDPTESTKHLPWVKQADGSWKAMANPDSTGNENTWYEDKIAFMWQINEKGFEKKGCDMSCHIAKDGKVDGVDDNSAGRHYTKNKGETNDLWHWKSTRTGAAGQADDQHVDASRQEAKGWGRKNDEGGGGYYDNKTADGKSPASMSAANAAAPRHQVRDEAKAPVDSGLKAGELINRFVAKALTGSRADVAVRGQWKDGQWTVEFKRKRVTAGDKAAEQDVQFADLAKTYHFGLSVFDHSQINHLFHKKAIALTFKR